MIRKALIAAALGAGVMGGSVIGSTAPASAQFGIYFGAPSPWYGGSYNHRPRRVCVPQYRTVKMRVRGHWEWRRVYTGQRCTWRNRW